MRIMTEGCQRLGFQGDLQRRVQRGGLRRGWGLGVLWVLASFGARRLPRGERKALWCARRRIPLPRVGIDAPTTARNGSCRPMALSSASVSEGFQRASGKPFGAPAGAYPLPRRGLTRRLRRG